MNMQAIDILQWLAFGGSLVSAYLYGNQGSAKGPMAGLATSAIFILFGFVANLPAAIISNIVFGVVHTRNLRRIIMGDEARTKKKICDMFNFLSKEIMPDRKKAKWWNNPLDGQSLEYFHQVPLKAVMVHSEVSEMVEYHRTSYIDDQGNIIWTPDKNITHIPGVAKELGDTIIRCIEISEALNLDLGAAIAETLLHNKVRPDHKVENMVKPGGKRY